MQTLVARPKLCSRRQLRGGEQMDIDVPSPPPEQGVAIDKMQNFRACGHDGLRQIRQGGQYGLARAQVAKSELSDNEGVRKNHPPIEQGDEPVVACAQMVDPDRGVDEDRA
jgi:hypothetical protein